MEAGIIVAALEENGIRATATGATTAGFRAEAPGWVNVLVAEEDVPRAEALLEEIDETPNAVDWSQVDVGKPEDEIATENDGENDNGTQLQVQRLISPILALLIATFFLFMWFQYLRP